MKAVVNFVLDFTVCFAIGFGLTMGLIHLAVGQTLPPPFPPPAGTITIVPSPHNYPGYSTFQPEFFEGTIYGPNGQATPYRVINPGYNQPLINPYTGQPQ